MDKKTKKRRDWTDEELEALDVKDYSVLIESLDTDNFIDKNSAFWGRFYSAMNKVEDRRNRAWRTQKENELREWRMRKSDFSVLLENLESRAHDQELLYSIQELKQKYNRLIEEESRFEDERLSDQKEMERLVNKLKVFLE